MARLTLLRKHRAFLLLVALAAALFLSDIWTYRDFVRAESYFALGARLMIERGEWLAPHAPDELLLNKPPVTYWAIGLSYKIVGTSYGSARLPSVLAALGVLAIVYALGVWMGGIRTGLISAAMLASSYLFMSFARLSMSDMLLTFSVTAALACFIVALSERTDRSRRLAIAGYVALAFGFLTKGPVTLVLVALPLVIELVLARDRELIKRLRPLMGIVLFVALTLPYFLLVYSRFGSQPLRFFFLGENLLRFTGGVYGSSASPFWQEFVAFFGDFAPWSALALLLPWFLWRNKSVEDRRPRGRRVVLLWLICTILLFSLSSFKLDYYLLPAMPAAALAVGFMLGQADRFTKLARLSLIAFLALSALAVHLVALLAIDATKTFGIPTPIRSIPGFMALGGFATILICMARRQMWMGAMTLAATIWAVMLTMQLTLTPYFARYLPATRLAAAVPAQTVLYTSRRATDWANSLAFSLPPGRSVERLSGDFDNSQLLTALQNNAPAVAVVGEREFAGLLQKNPSLRILAEAETYGHGGLNLNMWRNPQRERLLLVGLDH